LLRLVSVRYRSYRHPSTICSYFFRVHILRAFSSKHANSLQPAAPQSAPFFFRQHRLPRRHPYSLASMTPQPIIPRICPSCGSTDRYITKVSSGGGYAPNYLPQLSTSGGRPQSLMLFAVQSAAFCSSSRQKQAEPSCPLQALGPGSKGTGHHLRHGWSTAPKHRPLNSSAWARGTASYQRS
jgi:hypothetical protein